MPSSGERPLVLIVDDDPAMRLLMREALQQAGFAVEEAEDGMAALDAVNLRQPDAVLLDVLMPGMDGFAALAELRKRPESRGLPVSMVTGLDDTDSIRRAFAAGATDFLTKPINWTTLGYHVDHLLRASRAFVELQESRAYFNAILEDIPFFVCRLAPDGTISFVNEACCRYFGKSAEELVGRSFIPLIPEEDREKTRKHISSIGPARPVATIEHRGIRADGEIRWQRWTNRALFDEDGNITGFQSVGEDITEQKAAEEKLLLARNVFESSDEMITVTDLAANIIDVNPAFCRLTGYTREEVLGRNMRVLQLECHDQPFYEHHGQALLSAGAWQGEIRGRRKNGEPFTTLMTVNAVRNERGEQTHFVTLSTDITQLKKVEEQLRHLALFDPLTGLANRELLHDRLQQTLYEADRDRTQAALLMLDLDNFKDINDTLGHPSGDRILAQVGERLRERMRHSDTVARMGGDEFVIVLRNVTDSENVVLVAKGIVDSLSRPFLLEDRRVFLTVSIGIALYPLDGRDTDELIRKADTAMYHAKGQGKNRYQFFTAEMNRRAQERMALQTDLRRALERNEFVVHYQPKIRIGTGEVTGVEALLRWQKPEDGLVPPASFIPLAEETGLIVPIGEKVLRLACTQAKAWQAQGLPLLPVAVNLSAIQLREEGLAGTVQGILTETGLDPAALELEITESAIMQESEKAIAMLQAMREMGIRITMDDFGTGYSSLSYLKRFPISSLKIDRSFVAEVLSNADDAEISRAIIAMAHGMKLKVVAEGVETAEQLEFLRREGCDEAQGYYLARPMPAEEFSRWFQTRGTGDRV
jgi:diguanylate cyclase (GGDEF)-like protein/PAS domain S-box-containing protein